MQLNNSFGIIHLKHFHFLLTSIRYFLLVFFSFNVLFFSEICYITEAK